MGISKTELFTEEQNKLAAMAKAIAHPARIAILQYLSVTDTCICGDIVQQTGLAQATTSQHLKELKRVGLIQGSVEGASVCYCINPKVWNEFREVLSIFFKKVKSNQCC